VAREVLANELHGLRHALGGLVRRIRGLCDVQHWGVREARDLLQVRLDAVTLAVDAAWVELTALGGAAYRKTGPTARRLREAAFLPIQAPTVVQLRWELARLAEGSGQ
jgi:hypothetical protein